MTTAAVYQYLYHQANDDGIVHRTAVEMAQELRVPARTLQGILLRLALAGKVYLLSRGIWVIVERAL